MLVYAAIVPHSPFAIESVGKEKTKELTKSIDAMKRIGEDLASLNVDTIIVITPYGERYQHALGLAFHEPYVANLSEFGEMSTVAEFKPDMKLIDKIQRVVRRADVALTLTTNEVLDHASAVPLLMLREYIEGKRIVVMTPPVARAKDIVNAGSKVKYAINESELRVAVLCSAELSHRLSELSHGGVHPDAEEFDNSLRSALADGNSVPILKMTDEVITEQGAEGLDAIRLFWGILGDTDHTMEEVAYEHPFGIGQLTMVANIR